MRAKPQPTVSARWKLVTLGVLAVCCAGCPVFRSADVPAPIQQKKEPESGRKYYLYVPSSYQHTPEEGKPAREWPLVITCHGTVPWDTARRQILDWVELAEAKRFIVAAPCLQGTQGDFPPPANRQIKRQEKDERTILAVVKHIGAGHRIAGDKVFLTGWSAGNYAVLFTGLRHPEVFRGLAVLQGNFTAGYLAPVADHIDRNQPVYVLYGTSDILLKKQGLQCIKWLREYDANYTPEAVPRAHVAHPEKAYKFFRRVIKDFPWAVVRPYPSSADDSMTVKFKTDCSFEPKRYKWDFGDDHQSVTARPEHTYQKPGTYNVTVLLYANDEKALKRTFEVTVP